MKKLILVMALALAQPHSVLAESTSIIQNNWPQFFYEEVLKKDNINAFIPDMNYLTGWKESTEIAYSDKRIQPYQLKVKAVNCKDKRLWPTTPYESTKEYMYGASSSYTYFKLPADSSACLVRNYKKTMCLNATYANIFIMSDFYKDSCGNYYRGLWYVPFLKVDDNMGTLLSRGRTVYPKPNAQFPNEYITGYTYPVNAEDFLVLTEMNSAEIAKNEKIKAEALVKDYHMEGLSFIPNKK